MLSPRGADKTETIIEEALHALTVRKLPAGIYQARPEELERILRDKNQPMAVRRLVQAYQRAQASIGPEKYHMKNLAEFIAGAFREDGLKAELQAIKWPKSNDTVCYAVLYA